MAKPESRLHGLSRRLLIVMVALVGASLLLVDLGAVFFLRGVLNDNLAGQLRSTAHSTAYLYWHTGAVPDRLPLGYSIAIYGADGRKEFNIGAAPDGVPPLGRSQGRGSLRYTEVVPGGYFMEQVSTSSADAPVRILEGVLAVVTLAAMLLAAIVAQRLARGLAAPIAALSAEAGRIGETGDLETSLPRHHGLREIHDLEEALQRMLGRLRQTFLALEASEQRERALREMTLHDLRTPLSTVLGTLELLAGGRLKPAEAKEAAALAQREAARLATRIRDLDSSEGEPHTSLGPAVHRAARSHPVAAGEDLLVAAPTAEVEHVLDLLVDNAERHNPPGTPIALGWRREGDAAVAWVEDEGEGMSPEVRERAFERYYRGDRQGGLGLGLALVRVLTESRGGSVELDSAPGRGTRATVRWPLAPPAPEDAAED